MKLPERANNSVGGGPFLECRASSAPELAEKILAKEGSWQIAKLTSGPFLRKIL
jgi:hypothetical protein